MIPYPTMKQILEDAKQGVPGAKLLAAAISMLMTHPEFQGLGLTGTYEKVLGAAKEL